MWPFHRLRRLSSDQRGAVLVEFTLVAPLLISLMCGLAEFGLALRQYHVMEKGVRDAARYLARVPADPCAGTGDWTSRVAEAQWLAVTGRLDADAAPLVEGWSEFDTVTVDPDCDAVPQKVKVTATATYAGLGMLTLIGAGPLTLTAFNEQARAP